MYSDLFDALGGPGGVGGSSRRSSEPVDKPLVTLKAGKMDLEMQENGKYKVTADTRRGEIQLIEKASNSGSSKQLHWDWWDRREKTTVDSFLVQTHQISPLQKVDTGRPEDSVYYCLHGNTQQYHLYWMQDLEPQDESIQQINELLAKALKQQDEGEEEPAARSTTSSDQVDALSNILENLGMPQGTSSNNETTPSNALTLADLQGAMASIAPPQETPGPPLQDILTPAAIQELLQHEDICQQLGELLPEGKEQQLLDNLQSPQLQQTLRSLTAALLPDEETGNMDGYHSVLANFGLDPKHGEAALRAGNPIQAFLDCLVASVQSEQGDDDNEDDNDEEMKSSD